MDKNIFQGLNEKQKEAVLTTEGPVLIIAGAGSGKTKTLTHRVAYLLSQDVEPWNILAVTFTNKAANEMKERVGRMVSHNALHNLFISTFHSFGVRVLRADIDKLNLSRSFTIYDDDDQSDLIKRVMRDLNINTDQFNPTSVKYAISRAKSELIDEKKFEESAGGYFEEIVSKVYVKYQEYLRANNALDFDDLICRVVELWQNHPDVLAKYQERFRYIMVDEYQDTNHAQYVLVNLLAGKYRNLFVIGDDWQSIYLFRCADVQNILNFKQDYPDVKIISLERNYRSTQQILDAAYNVIKKNIQRTDKELWTQKENGQLLTSFEAGDEREEASFVTKEIRKMIELFPCEYKDFAVLYRTHAQSRVLEEAFLRSGIPYKIVGGIKFYSRAEIKDLIAFLKLINNSSDEISFRRVINVPNRGIGEVSLEKIISCQRQYKVDFAELLANRAEEINLTSKAKAGVNNFQTIFNDLLNSFKEPNTTLSKLLEQVIKQSGYLNYLATKDQPEMRVENTKELFTVTQKYDKLDVKEGLDKFLEEVALISDLDDLDENQNVVSLMTLHSAKGLEFNVVFISGLEEGILPHQRSIGSPAELEEERRLCYVGITRAKDKVYLLFTRARRIFGSVQANMPSRFLRDIPEGLVERRESDPWNGEFLDY